MVRRLFSVALCLAPTTFSQSLPQISKIATALDPANGNPQNIRISLFSPTLLTNFTIVATVKAHIGDKATLLDPQPMVSGVQDNPTGVYFLIPLSKLGQADQVSYELKVRQGGGAEAQLVPETWLPLSPVASIQGQADQIDTLNKQVNVLNQQLAAAQQAAKDAHAGILPPTPKFVDIRYKYSNSDNKSDVLAQFTTETGGRLHGKLVACDSPDVTIEEQTEKDSVVVHTFTFEKAAPGGNYCVEATVYDPDKGTDVPERTADWNTYEKLRFPMPARPDRPEILNLTIKEITSRSMTFDFDLGKTPAALQITCYLLKDPSSPNKRTPLPVASALPKFSPDQFKMDSGEFLTGHKEYSCEGLSPGMTYGVQVEAVDNFGQTVSDPDSATKTAGPLPAALEFEGPVQVDVRASGVQVTWNATVSGATATVEFLLAGKDPIPFPVKPTQTGGKSYSANLPIGELEKIIPALAPTPKAAADPTTKAAADPTTKGGAGQTAKTAMDPPTLTAKMTKGGEAPVSRSFQVSVSIPSTKDAVPKVAPKDAPKSTTDALTNVAAGVENPTQNKKFSWQDLLTTGLGALIKLI